MTGTPWFADLLVHQLSAANARAHVQGDVTPFSRLSVEEQHARVLLEAVQCFACFEEHGPADDPSAWRTGDGYPLCTKHYLEYRSDDD